MFSIHRKEIKSNVVRSASVRLKVVDKNSRTDTSILEVILCGGLFEGVTRSCVSKAELVALSLQPNLATLEQLSSTESSRKEKMSSSDPPLNPADVPEATNISVFIRVRPLLFHESDETDRNATSIISSHADKKTIAVTHPSKSLQCAYDRVFGENDDQNAIYDHIQPATTALVNGFNSTIFAYGQTGSGKTHTMFGPQDSYAVTQSSYGGANHASLSNSAGVIPRSIVQIFKELGRKDLNITEVTVYVSFVQVYNEQLYDMLRDPRRSASLEIHEEPGVGIYVSGLSEYAVRNAGDCLKLVKMGEENRAIRETHMNTASSRSHSLFQIMVEQKRISAGAEGERVLKSKFNLVDLAGSEKWDTKKESNMQNDHLSELTNINLSLYTLGRCIAALAKNAKSSKEDYALDHVPFRESKLTRLLQDSLGGNSKTMLIATLSPASDCLEETISTLRFADRAHQVMTFVRLNEKRPVDHALVQRLQSEVSRLRALLAEKGIEGGGLERALSNIVESSERKIGEGGEEGGKLSAANERIRFLETENNTLRKRLGMPEMPVSTPAPLGNSNLGLLVNEGNRQERAIEANETLRYDSNTPQRHTPKNFAIAGGGNSDQAEKIRAIYANGGGSGGGGGTDAALLERFEMIKSSHDRLTKIMSDLEGVTGRFFTFDIEEEELKTKVTSIMKVFKKEKKSFSAFEVDLPAATLKEMSSASSHSSRKENKPLINSNSTPGQSGMSLSGPSVNVHRNNSLHDQKLNSPGFSSSPNLKKSSPQPILGGIGGGGAAVKYRIRGKTKASGMKNNEGGALSPVPGKVESKKSSTTSWIEEEEEEEAALRNELKAAKARMAKQEKMQEWLEKKEQNALKALQEEEESRKSFEAERKEKDRKFRQRAKKQKKKLEKYYQKLREEVEAMDEGEGGIGGGIGEELGDEGAMGDDDDVMDPTRYDTMTLEELKALGNSYEDEE